MQESEMDDGKMIVDDENLSMEAMVNSQGTSRDLKDFNKTTFEENETINPSVEDQVPADLELKMEGSESMSKTSGGNFIAKFIVLVVIKARALVSQHKKSISWTIKGAFVVGITIYMIAACIKDFKRATPLFILWCLVVGYNIYGFIRHAYGKTLSNYTRPLKDKLVKNTFWIKWLFVICVLAALAMWIGFETSKHPRQLLSGGGYLLFIFLLFTASKYPDKVKWRPVLLGLLIQITIGVIILRTEAGFKVFNWLGDLTQTFINYVLPGVKFVYGETYFDHFVAFVVLSIVVYFSAFISILYYLGAMQWIILKISWLMQISLKTSGTESLVAAGNIFVGLVESPLLIKPYLNDLTTSELFAVMTSGFGTIAGSVLGAYLGFGIQPLYIITACFMAAPCALAIAKLVYPETEKSKFTSQEGLILEKSEQKNVIEAACVGASQAIPLILNISANLVAFISLLAAVNGFLNWFGSLMDVPELSFELICSYIFVPVTFMMGIEEIYCFKAAELIGIKLFLNEFVAYQSLSQMINRRDNGTIPLYDPNTGELNWVDERTEAIVTYALCGFSNVGAVGIMLGGLGSLIPKRQGVMSSLVVRALISGMFVSILNACVAGFFYYPRPIICDNILEATDWTYTEPSRLYTCCSSALNNLFNNYSSSLNGTVICNCCLHSWSETPFELNCSSIRCTDASF